MTTPFRRENEKVLLEQISQQVNDWMSELIKCQTLFVRAPKHQKHALLGPLHKGITDKNKIRPCPCPMNKPRFLEVVRMYNKIFSIRLQKYETEKEPVKVEKLKKPSAPAVLVKAEISEDEIELSDENLERSFDDLKVFKHMKKKPKKPKPKIEKKEPIPELKPEEKYKHELNELFTAVKGNQAADLDKIILNMRSEHSENFEEIINLPIDADKKVK